MPPRRPLKNHNVAGRAQQDPIRRGTAVLVRLDRPYAQDLQLAAIADRSHPVGNVMLWKQRGESEPAELQGEDAIFSAHGLIQQAAVDFDGFSVMVAG